MHSPHFAYLEYATAYNKPFVSYRLPNTEQHTTLILNENSVIEFHNYSEILDKKGFVFVPFNAEKDKNLFISPEEILFGDKGFRGDLFLDKNKKQGYSKLPLIDEGKENYNTQFQQFYELLEKKVLKKAILSRTLTLDDFSKEEQVYTYYNLAENYPNAMVYWVHLPHLGVEWMGATPEMLVKQEGNDLHTMALAGTKKPNEEWSNKEREEQQMVVDYISSQLADYQLILSENETLDTGVVQHLVTHFSLPNASSQLFKVIEKLHPTPAVCGVPKAVAFDQIQRIETHKRGYYCGFLGVMGIAQTTATFVNLRCMQLAENSVRLYVGGGLTQSSNFEREWEETERKAETLLRFLR